MHEADMVFKQTGKKTYHTRMLQAIQAHREDNDNSSCFA